MQKETKTIDLTPTWSAIGEIYIRFAESREIKAIMQMRGEVRRAFAMATAAVAMSKSDEWNDAQKERFNELYQQALGKYPTEQGEQTK